MWSLGRMEFAVAMVALAVHRFIDESGRDLRLVVWDLSTSPYVDIAVARPISELQRYLAGRGARLRIVEARAPVRELIRKEVGLTIGEISRRISVDDVVNATA